MWVCTVYSDLSVRKFRVIRVLFCVPSIDVLSKIRKIIWTRPGVDYIGKLSIKLQFFCPKNVIDYNELHQILNVID